MCAEEKTMSEEGLSLQHEAPLMILLQADEGDICLAGWEINSCFHHAILERQSADFLSRTRERMF